MIQAVVFDLDDTAVPNGRAGMPSAAMISAIDRARSTLKLSAATGRSWDFARPVIKALKLTDPCIVSGGTVIIDPVSEQIVWEASIEPASALAIADFMRAHPDNVNVYMKSLHRGDDLDHFDPADINIMYVLDVPLTALDDALTKLRRIPHITVSKATSWGRPDDGIDLHITSNVATKEHAVQELAGIIGVPTSGIAGVGDGHNDIHLFNAVGHRVAMGNAVPELKANADEVIDTVGNDGLAKYILTLC
jgi:HAD superfamily hydrolase (TIGR01484 family)